MGDRSRVSVSLTPCMY